MNALCTEWSLPTKQDSGRQQRGGVMGTGQRNGTQEPKRSPWQTLADNTQEMTHPGHNASLLWSLWDAGTGECRGKAEAGG